MIDWDRVAQLRDEVGPEDFCEVVDLFLEEVDGAVARLAGADPAGLENHLHFLKGSALNLGFARFGRMCQQAEQRAAAGEDASDALAPITACYAESRKAFLDALPRRRVA